MSARIEARERRFGEPIVVALNNGCTAISVVPATDLARVVEALRELVEADTAVREASFSDTPAQRAAGKRFNAATRAARSLLAEVDR